MKTESPDYGMLVRYGWMHASQSSKLISERYPEIMASVNIEHFTLAQTIATVCATVIRIQRHLGDADYKGLRSQLAVELNAAYDRGSGIYSDLVDYLNNEAKATPSKNVRILPEVKEWQSTPDDIFAAGIGFWIVGNGKGDRPNSSDDRLVSIIGRLVYFADAVVIAELFMGLLNKKA